METAKHDPESMIPLTPAVYHIIVALADGKEQHGYSIMQAIAAQTAGKVHIGATTLYRSIKQMLIADMIVESEERPIPSLEDERRRYYRLTDLGWQVLLAEKRRLAYLIALAEQVELQRPHFSANSQTILPLETHKMTLFKAPRIVAFLTWLCEIPR